MTVVVCRRNIAAAPTSLLVPQDKFPGQKIALDICKLAPPEVYVIVALPEMPSLLHLTNLIAFTVLHYDRAVDEMGWLPHPEDYLLPCVQGTKLHMPDNLAVAGAISS